MSLLRLTLHHHFLFRNVQQFWGWETLPLPLLSHQTMTIYKRGGLILCSILIQFSSLAYWREKGKNGSTLLRKIQKKKQNRLSHHQSNPLFEQTTSVFFVQTYPIFEKHSKYNTKFSSLKFTLIYFRFFSYFTLWSRGNREECCTTCKPPQSSWISY